MFGFLLFSISVKEQYYHSDSEVHLERGEKFQQWIIARLIEPGYIVE
jgi:hypothetical protein